MVSKNVGCTDAGCGSWTADGRIGVSRDLKWDYRVHKKQPVPAQEYRITNDHSDFGRQGGHLSGRMEASRRGWGRVGWGGTWGTSTYRCVWRGHWGRIVFGRYRATSTVQDRK